MTDWLYFDCFGDLLLGRGQHRLTADFRLEQRVHQSRLSQPTLTCNKCRARQTDRQQRSTFLKMSTMNMLRVSARTRWCLDKLKQADVWLLSPPWLQAVSCWAMTVTRCRCLSVQILAAKTSVCMTAAQTPQRLIGKRFLFPKAAWWLGLMST